MNIYATEHILGDVEIRWTWQCAKHFGFTTWFQHLNSGRCCQILCTPLDKIWPWWASSAVGGSSYSQLVSRVGGIVSSCCGHVLLQLRKAPSYPKFQDHHSCTIWQYRSGPAQQALLVVYLYLGLFHACHLFQVLISRNYRGDIEPSVIDKFMPLLMDREEEGNMSPIIQVITWINLI